MSLFARMFSGLLGGSPSAGVIPQTLSKGYVGDISGRGGMLGPMSMMNPMVKQPSMPFGMPIGGLGQFRNPMIGQPSPLMRGFAAMPQGMNSILPALQAMYGKPAGMGSIVGAIPRMPMGGLAGAAPQNKPQAFGMRAPVYNPMFQLFDRGGNGAMGG